MAFATTVSSQPTFPEIGVSEATFGSEGTASRRKLCLLRLNSIRALPPDWDGAGAEPIRSSAFNSAIDLLEELRKNDIPPPHRIVASPSGSIVFEWQSSGNYLEAEMVDSFVIEWMYQARNQPTEHRTQIVLPHHGSRLGIFFEEYQTLADETSDATSVEYGR